VEEVGVGPFEAVLHLGEEQPRQVHPWQHRGPAVVDQQHELDAVEEVLPEDEVNLAAVAGALIDRLVQVELVARTRGDQALQGGQSLRHVRAVQDVGVRVLDVLPLADHLEGRAVATAAADVDAPLRIAGVPEGGVAAGTDPAAAAVVFLHLFLEGFPEAAHQLVRRHGPERLRRQLALLDRLLEPLPELRRVEQLQVPRRHPRHVDPEEMEEEGPLEVVHVLDPPHEAEAGEQEERLEVGRQPLLQAFVEIQRVGHAGRDAVVAEADDEAVEEHGGDCSAAQRLDGCVRS
jgi:hypothetical protein